MGSLARDLRFGLRQLASRPAFSTVAVLTLAVGIGAVAAIVTVANAVLVEGLPYAESGDLMLVTGVNRAEPEAGDWPIAYLDFADWRERTDGFADLAAHTNPRSFNLLTDGEPERVSGEMVSASYFRILRVDPLLGRTFTPQEDSMPADHRVVVVSHDLWQRLLGGARDLAGVTLSLNEESYQVVGVMPPGFAGLTDEAQLWVPVVLASKILGPHYIQARPFRWLTVLGRLGPGVTVEQAQAELDSVTAALEEEYPDVNEGIGARVTPLAEAWFGDLRPALVNLGGGAAFVLLIACANVAHRRLARATGRQREVGVRRALGAGRWRLVRQLLTEGLLLAAAGGVLGVLLARWSTGLLTRFSATGLRSFVHFELDPPVVAASAAAVLVCVVLFGAAPAWIGSRVEPGEVLKEGTRGAAGGRRHLLVSLLVVFEVFVAVVLLVAAGLSIRGFQRLRGTELGFEARGLITLRTDLQGQRWAGQPPKLQLIRELLERLPASPGAGEVALAGPVIPTDDWLAVHMTVDDWSGPGGQEMATLNVHSVSPGYFATLGVPLLDGRDFTLADTPEAPFVTVVSEAMARRFWPGEEPLGKQVKFGPREGGSPWFTVVGVVGDVRHRGLGEEGNPNPDVYFSILHIPPMTPPVLNVLARPEGGGAPEALAPELSRALRETAPTLPVYDVRTMEARLDEQVARDRFLLSLMTVFAGLALGLAAVGIYGVLSYAVAQRRREIGVRMALGAGRGTVVGQVLRRGALLAGIGIVAGAVAAVPLSRLLERFLHGVSATDAVSFASAALVLFAAALVASYLPARRAARVEPAVTLREE